MNKMLLFFFFFCLAIAGAAQSVKSNIAVKDTVMEAKLRSIRNVYSTVNRESKSMRVVTADVPDKSAEGGVSRKFYTGKELRKLVIQLYGETGRFTGEYYFNDAKICFYYTLEERYNSSIAVPGNKVTSKKEDRFYFSAGKLIYWIGDGGKIQPSVGYTSREKEIMAELGTYLPAQ